MKKIILILCIITVSMTALFGCGTDVPEGINKNVVSRTNFYLKNYEEGWSRQELKEQLLYDGYKEEDIEKALDYLDVDYGEEAYKKINALLKENQEFTTEQIKTGLKLFGFSDDEIEYAIEKHTEEKPETAEK